MERDQEKTQGREREGGPRQEANERVREHARRQLALERTGGRFTPAAQETPREQVREDREIAVLREQVPGLRGENWQKADWAWGEGGRLETVRETEKLSAGMQNRPRMKVSDERMAPGEHGRYHPESNRCVLNHDELRQKDPAAARAYFHETRHAYIFDVMRDPASHPEVSASKVKEWREAEKTYKVPGAGATEKEWEAYRNHAFEKDAREYAERQMIRLYGQDRKRES